MNQSGALNALTFFAVLSTLAPVYDAVAKPAASHTVVSQTASYTSLTPPKAMAVSPGSDIAGIAGDQPHLLAASTNALERCERQRQIQSSACEISRLNDQRISTGHDILKRLPPTPHPLYLWRLKDSSATIYLAGSIHILKPSLYPLPPAFEKAFESADKLVLEVNLAAYSPEQIQQRTMAHALLPAGQTLNDQLDAGVADGLSTALADYGMSAAQVQRLKPVIVMNQLLLAQLMTFGYHQRHGLEQHFLDKSGDRDILELETLEQQFSVLFDQPMPVQVQLLEDTLESRAELEPLLADLILAWLAGDDAEFLNLFQQSSGDSELADQFNKNLLDRRNIVMAAKIREYLNGDGTYFVLVGAAHFLGDAGIVSLLEQQGLSAQRIFSDSQI